MTTDVVAHGGDTPCGAPAPGFRRCYQCKETKPLRKFVVSKAKPGGRSYRCMSCRDRARRARATDETRALQNDRDRAKRANNAETRAKLRANEARYAKANRRKNLAHVAVYEAVRSGKLKRGPCEVCGSARVEAHHDDYAQRLSVRWLCPLHHKAWHAKNGEGANAHG